MSTHLLKSTFISATMTFMSRILGFARDVIIARIFGVSIATDAFFVAFKIPNFLRRLFAEGAFSQAFVPVLSESQSTQSDKEVKQLLDHVAGTLGLILLVITLCGMVLAPIIIMIFAPGYLEQTDNRYDLAVSMLRITFPYLFFISLTAFAGAILNTYSRFAVPAFAPVLLNISFIACAIWLAPQLDTPIYALAWAVFLGGIAQLALLLPFLKQINKLPRPRYQKKHSGVKKILVLMLPALFGVSVSQINLLLDTVIASFLAEKSISWLYYADRLLEFPLGLFGVAIATVILPSLSKDHAKKDPKSFTNKMDWSLRLVLLISAPAAIALFLLTQPLLITLFQYGKLSATDVIMSGWALKAYAFGLLAFIFIKVLANGYFSRQDTKTPVKAGIIAMASNMILNLIFVLIMIQQNFIAPHMGLALATTCSAMINAALLYRGLHQQGIYQLDKTWIFYSLKILIALLLMTATIVYLNPEDQQWLNWSLSDRVIRLTEIIIVAILTYFSATTLMKIKFWQLKEN